MQRFVKTLDLKDSNDTVAKYIKAHEEIPSEIIEGIKSVGITLMDLYLHGNRVVMVMECPDSVDIEKSLWNLASLPGQEDWEKFVSNFQDCRPSDSSAEKWREMKKIFSLPRPKVFVSGCYDMLHSGHVAFFKEASQYGDLYVGIGSDETIKNLKNRPTVYSERERLYMVKSIRHVKDAMINRGSGMMDFIESIEAVRPDIFVVNSDGGSTEKRKFCEQRGIQYIELQRLPEKGLDARSTTSLRKEVKPALPYRVDIAGTWIDQPYVSQFGGGWAITASIEPTEEFMERGGMSTSTRKMAKTLWKYQIPDGDEELLAKILFCFENQPEDEKSHISGAQDAIGICLSGLSRHFYDNTYWPSKIERVYDEKILDWLESHMVLVPMFPRVPGVSVIDNKDINQQKVKNLTDAAEKTWQAILKMDLGEFAKGFQDSFHAQVAMFPAMMQPGVDEYIEKVKADGALAWKMTGAGGGGYLLVVHNGEKIPQNSLPLKIRRLS